MVLSRARGHDQRTLRVLNALTNTSPPFVRVG